MAGFPRCARAGCAPGARLHAGRARIQSVAWYDLVARTAAVVKGPGHFRLRDDFVKSFTSLLCFYLVALGLAGRGLRRPRWRRGGAAHGRAAAGGGGRDAAAADDPRAVPQHRPRPAGGQRHGRPTWPIDEGIAGFFGNTIAPVSELHLEKYGRAADLVARRSVAKLGRLLPCDPAKVGERPARSRSSSISGGGLSGGRSTGRRARLYQASCSRPGGPRAISPPGLRLVLQAHAAEPELPLPGRAGAPPRSAGRRRWQRCRPTRWPPGWRISSGTAPRRGAAGGGRGQPAGHPRGRAPPRSSA